MACQESNEIPVDIFEEGNKIRVIVELIGVNERGLGNWSAAPEF